MTTITITDTNEIIYGVDYSDREGRTKKEISKEDFAKIQNGLARFDIETNKIIDIPKIEVPEIIESEEEIEARELESKIKDAEALVIRKLALQELEESTTEIEAEITTLKSSLTSKTKEWKK